MVGGRSLLPTQKVQVGSTLHQLPLSLIVSHSPGISTAAEAELMASPGPSSGRLWPCHTATSLSFSPLPFHIFQISPLWEILTLFVKSCCQLTVQPWASHWTTASLC